MIFPLIRGERLFSIGWRATGSGWALRCLYEQ
jgi:hypothetical protein